MHSIQHNSCVRRFDLNCLLFRSLTFGKYVVKFSIVKASTCNYFQEVVVNQETKINVMNEISSLLSN